MTAENIRLALFPCTYREAIDGNVANTSRQFAAFAKERGFPFLLVHAGPSDEIVTDGLFTRVQLRRGRAKFPLDGHHEFDLLFFCGTTREFYSSSAISARMSSTSRARATVRNSGALSWLTNLSIPLTASWQTNLHQFARCRVSSLLSSWPANLSAKLAAAAEFATFHAAVRFYKIPRLLFTPNRELVELLGKATGKPCFLMSPQRGHRGL